MTTLCDQPFEITLRFAILRLVCYAALILMVWRSAQREYFGCALSIVVLFHHALVSLGPRFSLPRLMDLVLTLGQIGVMAAPILPIPTDKWGLSKIIFDVMIWWTLFSHLVLFSLLKIADIVKWRGRNLFERYNIGQTKMVHSDAHTHPHVTSHDNLVRTVKEIFLGKAIWEAQLHGEPKWIILSRGILAASAIMVITVVACYNIIFETVRQEILTPVNDVRSYWLPPDFTPSKDTVWDVVLTRVITAESLEKTNFSSAVKVNPLWDASNGPGCSWIPYKPSATPAAAYGPSIFFESVTFHCPERVSITNQYFYPPTTYRNLYPDLLVTVNFTMLDILSDSIEDTPTNSVQLVVGLTRNTATVIGRTSPTTLIPGVNLVGIVNLSIRQVMSNSKLASLGWFDVHETFYIANVVHVWPDPRASTSPLITRASDIATIRLIPQMDYSEWKIVQERRDKSVLRGFSTAGGLWTVLGGIFTLCFGSSILRVMFRVKPLSVFGLVHNVQKNQIRDACLKDYPYVTQDINRVPRGFTSFISDYLINVEHFFCDDDKLTGDETRVDTRNTLQPLPPIRPSSPFISDRPESA